MIICILLFFVSYSYSCEKFAAIPEHLKTGKLYEKDFGQLGIVYTPTLETKIDKALILKPEQLWGYQNLRRCQPELYMQMIEQRNSIFAQLKSKESLPALYLKFINDRIGFGVFTEALIRTDELVVEYSGQLVVEGECLMDGDYAIDAGPHYVDTHQRRMLNVDAALRGNYSRFINHSAEYNLYSVSLFNPDDAMWHVALFAKKDIPADGQLFITYGDDYWKSRGIIPVDLNTCP